MVAGKDFRQFSHAPGERITASARNSAGEPAPSGKVACWLAHRVHFPRSRVRIAALNRNDALYIGPATAANHRPELEKEPSVANIKSQMKRILTNKKATDRNKAVKSELRTAIRATREAVAAGDKDKATSALLLASKKLDKAASKGVIHKNQAANKKSAIARQVGAL